MTDCINKDFIQIINSDQNYFEEACVNILQDKSFLVNLYKYNNTIYYLTKNQTMFLKDVIVVTLTNEINKYYNIIQQHLTNNTFTLITFINTYNELDAKIYKLQSNLTPYITHIKYLNLPFFEFEFIKFVLIDDLLLNSNFVFQNKKTTLLEILNFYLETNTDTDIVLELFKLKQFYYNFSEKYDLQQKNTFMDNLSYNEIIIKEIAERIHNDLFCNNFMNNILIHFVNSLKDTKLFYACYISKLEYRILFTGQYNLENQYDFISHMNENIQDLQNISFILNDVKTSLIFKEGLSKVKINTKSSEYTNYDLTTLDKNMLNAKFLRYSVWNVAKQTEYTSYKIPYDLNIYLSLATKFYLTYNSHKKLIWNHNFGIATINLKLGNKKYKFNITTFQLLVLWQFNSQDKITIIDISKNTGIVLKNLGPTINTLLKHKILVRDKNKLNNDPTAELLLNDNYTSDEQLITLF